jgi:hypothetical protein
MRRPHRFRSDSEYHASPLLDRVSIADVLALLLALVGLLYGSAHDIGPELGQ